MCVSVYVFVRACMHAHVWGVGEKEVNYLKNLHRFLTLVH